MRIEQFLALADAFGADLERWPAVARPAAHQLLASSAQAKTALADARALDGLLDRAPSPVTAHGADLLDRIVAAATASNSAPGKFRGDPAARSPMAQRSGNVVALPPRGPHLAATTATPRPARQAARIWPVAAALAASLALGITIGAHDLTHAPVRGLIEIASVETDVDQFVAALHADGLAIAADEEHL